MEPKRCYGCMKLKQNSPICEHCGFDERGSNAPNHLPQGTYLRGQYLVGRVLGQGGFGITYMGRDTKLDVPVAIKEYFPSGMVHRNTCQGFDVYIASEKMRPSFRENRERFLREARTLAQLADLPEVVSVLNFFEANNTAYIVMGFVEGVTLKDYVRSRGGKLTVQQTMDLMFPLMEALEKVHALGLVHRDISPDNVMIQPGGRVRLIDFGAAHVATNPNDDPTQAVLRRGYAPIEQYQSDAPLGPWTDVYALCATVYYCLTGATPPYATDRVNGSKAFSWGSIRGLTADQRAALEHGLEQDYTCRIQSMTALKRALAEPETVIDVHTNTHKEPDSSALRKVAVVLAAVAAVLAIVLLLPGKNRETNNNPPSGPVAAQPPTVDLPRNQPAVTQTLPEQTQPATVQTQGSSLQRENPFAGLRVGDIVSFGVYEQDNRTGNGPEPISWEVIDRRGDELVLMSRYALDCRSYHNSDTKVTWADSALRQWLNDDFLYRAFSEEEQEYILQNTSEAHRNPDYTKVNPGADCRDYVWLLSVEEALDYFPDYRDRACEATAYAEDRGLRVCWWWLRTPGESQENAVSINKNGSWDEVGSNVYTSKGGVRPLIRVDAGA